MAIDRPSAPEIDDNTPESGLAEHVSTAVTPIAVKKTAEQCSTAASLSTLSGRVPRRVPRVAVPWP